MDYPKLNFLELLGIVMLIGSFLYSDRRWLSVVYAIAGVVIVRGMGAWLLHVASSDWIRLIGDGRELASIFAAALGAHQPARLKL